jgi:hypothetical protein
MELYNLDAAALHRKVDGLDGIIHENTHRYHKWRQFLDDPLRGFMKDAARGQVVENKTECISPGIYRLESVLLVRNAADFDFYHSYFTLLCLPPPIRSRRAVRFS